MTKDDKGQEVVSAGEVTGVGVAAAGTGVAGTWGASSGILSSQFTRFGGHSSSSTAKDISGDRRMFSGSSFHKSENVS